MANGQLSLEEAFKKFERAKIRPEVEAAEAQRRSLPKLISILGRLARTPSNQNVSRDGRARLVIGWTAARLTPGDHPIRPGVDYPFARY